MPDHYDLDFYWTNLCRLIRYQQIPTRFPRGWSVFYGDYNVVHKKIKAGTKFDTILWEATSEPNTIKLLRRKCRKLIVIPQNIESLGAQNSGDIEGNSRRLKLELKAYAQADAVFTITEAESWLFRLFGINANCLPYYPPTALRQRLLAIRSKRQELNQEDFLLFVGSMGNPPTRQGLTDLLTQLTKIGGECRPKIIIAGNGTDELAVDPSLNVIVVGRVDDEQLDDLRAKAKATIVHQRSTTGIITRILESLIAGLPVIANKDAARGYEAYSDVHCYPDIHHMPEIFYQNLSAPQIPERPIADELRFQQTFENLH